MARKKDKDNTDTSQAMADITEFLNSSGFAVETLEERDEVSDFLHTNSYAMNWIITNSFFKGLPKTKVIAIHGDPASGKSLITASWLGQNIRDGGISLLVDTEDSAGFDFTSKIVGGADIAKQIRLISAKQIGKKTDAADYVITIERLTTMLNKLVDLQMAKKEGDRKHMLVVIDSVSVLSSDKEITDVRDEKDKRDMTSAQKMRTLFRALTPMFRHANITIVGVAHDTANIGVMFGESKVMNAKGSAFGYASSLILKTMSSKAIENKSGIPIGIRMKFQTHKNRFAFKGRNCFVTLNFNKGIEKYSGLAELLAKYGLVNASAKANLDGSYKSTVTFEYVKNDGEVIKFTQSNIGDVFEAQGGEEFLIEIEDKLNKIYLNMVENDSLDVEDLLYDDEENIEVE